MMTNRQLTRSCQSAFLNRLADWHRHHSYGLYRRTDDFVQWFLLQKSSFDVLVRPAFAMQALAQQESSETITLGDMARTQQGAELWITPEHWSDQQSFLVDMIIDQIKPSITVPLTAATVRDYLEGVPNNHVDFLVARGIASVVLGQNEGGRHHLEQALKQYSQMDVDWAREEAQRIRSWLACSDATLLAKLREDAQAGAELLNLK